MNQPDVENLIQQTRRYEFADGLRDFQLAVMFALLSVAIWLSFEPRWILFVVNMSYKLGGWASLLHLLPIGLAPLAVWGMLYVMGFLRRRWLWRESGMVKASRWVVPRRVSLISAALLIGGLLVGFVLNELRVVDSDFVWRMLWAATGWSFGYTLVGVGGHIGLKRYFWLGLIGGLASTAIIFLPLPFGQGALAFGLAWCVLLAISGVIALRQALPIAQEDTHGG